MITNSSMTHYHKGFDDVNRLETWTRYNYGIDENDHKIMWQGGKGARFNKGLEEGNDVKIRIPYSQNNVSIDNFKRGDIVVKGTITQDISKQSDLSDYDTFNITSITNNNFGQLDIQHIHLEAK